MSHHLVGMAEIAEMLGVSRQRVSQLISSYEDFPPPEVELAGGRVWDRTAVETWIAGHPDRGPGRPESRETPPDEGVGSANLFTRFTDVARQSIVKAQEEARLFHHNYIGTEHLLLGQMAVEDGLAWRVLRSLDVAIDVLRDYLREMIGEGTEPPHGHIPFTPRAKKVLELALREALQLNHNYIGTEHILLALVRDGDGVAWQMLVKAGLKENEVRAAVVRQTGIHVAVEDQPPLRKARGRVRRGKIADLLKCSFCTKTQAEVTKLVAGPGVYICDECIDLCNEIIAEEQENASVEPSSDVLSRLAELESRIAELELRPDD